MGRVTVSRLLVKVFIAVSIAAGMCAALCACSAWPADGPAPASARSSVRPQTDGRPIGPLGRPSPASRNIPSTTDCRPGGTARGFALSIAAGATGSATALAAAEYFVRHGGQPGFGTPTSTWRVVATTPTGIELRGDDASVHVARMPNRRWIVDSGTACV
jgi:hypothetical protein